MKLVKQLAGVALGIIIFVAFQPSWPVIAALVAGAALVELYRRGGKRSRHAAITAAFALGAFLQPMKSNAEQPPIDAACGGICSIVGGIVGAAIWHDIDEWLDEQAEECEARGYEHSRFLFIGLCK